METLLGTATRLAEMDGPSDQQVEWYRHLLTNVPGDPGIDWPMVAADLLVLVDALRAAQFAAQPEDVGALRQRAPETREGGNA